MDHVELLFVKMSANAVTPTRATEGSVGLDFYSPANYIIPPYSQLLIPTQIKLGIPLGHYGRLASTSGLAIFRVPTAPGKMVTVFPAWKNPGILSCLPNILEK